MPLDRPCREDPSTARVEDVRRIAVLRAGGLGDLVFALPALEALRDAYPDAAITVLCSPAQHALLSSRPGPWSEALIVPAGSGLEDGGGAPHDDPAVEAFFASMVERRFDLAIQLHGGGAQSNPFVRRLRAGVSAGSHTPDAPRLDRSIPHPYFHPEAVRWIEVVGLVGASPRAPLPRLLVTPDDRAAAAAALPPPLDGRPEVTLHPGAGSPRRRWPVQAFVELGRMLTSAGARPVVVGAETECDLTATVTEGIGGIATNMGGRLALPALVGVLARAAVHVGNDSGPSHLARALGTPTATVFWGPNLINAGPVAPAALHRTHPSWVMDCGECGSRVAETSCPHTSSLVSEVPVSAVATSALELLEQHAHRRGGADPESRLA